MKKILLLGGSQQQVIAIKKAKELGYFTVLCDYLNDNPGQYVADKFYLASTTDKNTILKVAKNEKVDGIIAYASDPAAPIAAYVSEKLGLPTNPYQSIDILCHKDKFRKFLDENDFATPKAKGYSSLESASDEINNFKFPIIVKPTDSSGSKGVTKLNDKSNLEINLQKAISFSRSNRLIVEQFIEKDHDYLIGGDCFVIDGKVVYWGLLNCHRDNTVSQLVPVGKSYPLKLSEEREEKVKFTFQKLITELNIKFGGFNIEAIVDKNDDVYIIELGARNGGNMIPDLLKLISDVDMVTATIETTLGNEDVVLNFDKKESFYSTQNLHTSKNGVYRGLRYYNGIKEKIVKSIIYKKDGDKVEYFDGANKAIGIVFFKFNNQKEMLNIMNHMNDYIEIVVE